MHIGQEILGPFGHLPNTSNFPTKWCSRYDVMLIYL